MARIVTSIYNKMTYIISITYFQKLVFCIRTLEYKEVYIYIHTQICTCTIHIMSCRSAYFYNINVRCSAKFLALYLSGWNLTASLLYAFRTVAWDDVQYTQHMQLCTVQHTHRQNDTNMERLVILQICTCRISLHSFTTTVYSLLSIIAVKNV